METTLVEKIFQKPVVSRRPMPLYDRLLLNSTITAAKVRNLFQDAKDTKRDLNAPLTLLDTNNDFGGRTPQTRGYDLLGLKVSYTSAAAAAVTDAVYQKALTFLKNLVVEPFRGTSTIADFPLPLWHLLGMLQITPESSEPSTTSSPRILMTSPMEGTIMFPEPYPLLPNTAFRLACNMPDGAATDADLNGDYVNFVWITTEVTFQG